MDHAPGGEVQALRGGGAEGGGERGRHRVTPPRVPPGAGGYLELGSQGVAGPLQRGGVQAFLVTLQAVPVLRLLHGLVHVLEDVPALVPGSAQLVVLRGARCDGGVQVRRRWIPPSSPSFPPVPSQPGRKAARPPHSPQFWLQVTRDRHEPHSPKLPEVCTAPSAPPVPPSPYPRCA